MKICEFNDEGICRSCGAARHNDRQLCGPLPAGLGDLVAFGLSAIGITKDRAQAVAQAVGLEDCGCDQRQQLLNQLGYRLGIGEPLDFNDPPPGPQSTS